MQMQCWLVGFRDWWLESGEEWPVRPNRDFHAQAWWYANNRKTGDFETTSDMFASKSFHFHGFSLYFEGSSPLFQHFPIVFH